MNPIDAWIHAELRTKGLEPSPRADRRTLIRRVTYDLTGLPPTPAEVAAFESDQSPIAYEKVVDRLLASPHYGEQWGRHWLDVVRFGESRGYERNEIIPNAWPFRDYVIRSFNEDKPFDRLVREHLAGDVIGKDQPDVEVGVTFLVCGPYDDVGNQDAAQAAVIRANTLDDVIRATGESFLGLTIGCARCHDHKFDPLTQKDYYSLYATFAGVRHGVREVADASDPRRARRARPTAGTRSSCRVEGRASTPPTRRSRRCRRCRRGGSATSSPRRDRSACSSAATRNGREAHVNAASPGVFAAVEPGYELPADTPESRRRLALADWLVDPRNPLTPRVLANRVWHYHFGTGLVDTPSDFGFMGGRPSHPELLDWLARRLLDDGWRLKPLHRLIVTSRNVSSSVDISRSRRARRRRKPLALAVPATTPCRRGSARHDAGGCRFARSPDGRAGIQALHVFQDNVATYVPLDRPGPETYRRSVYHHSARASYVDVLTDFDCPDNAFGAPRRASTTTPLQALPC